ncbi:MAG: enoyl-CoA hydratase, partial [Myxococcales bacterium]|nr:enoyl-CoA hydratase [Myxococcales bacterium]
EEALRIGLVQQITDTGQELEVALEIASTVARRAPLGVQATLESAWHQEAEGFDAARGALLSQARKLMQSEDAAEGLRSFVERREAAFKGR